MSRWMSAVTSFFAFALLVAASLSVLDAVKAEPQDPQPPSAAYYVIGAVVSPGRYLLDPDMTVGQAIARAGGVKTSGDADSVTISRVVDGEKVMLPASADDLLKNGDTVYVPPRR